MSSGLSAEFILSARAVVADPQTLIADGAVAAGGGQILAVGPRQAIRRRFTGVMEQVLEGQVLLPGLVNAHTHLELSDLAGRIPAPRHFTEWVLELGALSPPSGRTDEAIAAAVTAGAGQSIRYGVTTIGDISRHCAASRRALRDGPLRVVSFGEIMALGRLRDRLEARLAGASERGDESDFLSIGLSPHAPYSVEGPALRQIARVAEARHLPLAMHLAELQEEREFLATLGGRLGGDWEVMRRLNLLDADIPRFADGPVAWAEHYGLLGAQVPVVLAHLNYASADDIDRLARRRAAVAFCPRTHHYFGHDRQGRHRWREMLANGINVCLATDSLASNPDLSLLGEAQFVQREYPLTDPRELFSMLTTRPARALGLAGHLGALTPGYRADLVAMPIPADLSLSIIPLLEYLIATPPPAEQVWINGRAAL